MRSTQQQTQKHNNDSGLFSSLKSMANDLIGNSPSHHHHSQQQQPVKRVSSNVSTHSNSTTPQINTSTSTTSKTQTLFPSYQTLQIALPQEIERVRSVLQNPNATLSQLEQGDRALDDLVVLLSSQLAQLAELKRDTSQKLINKLKQQQPSNSNVAVSPVNAKSPVSSIPSSNNNTTNVVKPQTPTTETNKGFGALANRSTTSKPSTPSSGSSGNLTKTVQQKPTTTANPLESMLEWQENETVIVEAPKTQVKEQELFSMDSFDDTFTHSANNGSSVPPPATTSVSMTDDILGFDNTTTVTTSSNTQSTDDILGFESSSKPKEGAFLDELLGTENNNQGGVMIDFSDEGQKIYQSNQILSMFDKPAETATSSILDAEDIPVATTTAVNSVDEFDF